MYYLYLGMTFSNIEGNRINSSKIEKIKHHLNVSKHLKIKNITVAFVQNRNATMKDRKVQEERIEFEIRF